MILYGYFRSSASYRVRIGLNLKGLNYESRSVHLLRNGGEQHTAEYRRLNPLGRVPTLLDGAAALPQSLAILEYLEERHPQPPLLPADPVQRARARALALTIACDIQPLQNTSTTAYLRERLGLDKDAVHTWLGHWIGQGLRAVEAMLAEWGGDGPYCLGATASLADCCLVPQCYAARRFKQSFDELPLIARIDAHCRAQQAFARAAPELQADYEA